ncbi:universal stress protein [Herbaspirillum sp. WKF16]|jgi:nucleotide-binding universal stress UspA family protein|uniref:universal stress protein n=1 Tax=Herbaspirillum sp. WKF16 TaxID=3028312 RepID=UPI0023A96CB1|nr:universal stress protein [Herbaspirillum sp. WKF16]WDZ98315.1 universal stress protein [Herbaspirillum sp. WKF16]
MFKNILLATDGSRLCNESVKAAIALAKSCGSKLVGLSVAGNLRALSIPEVSVGVDVQQADEAGRAKALASIAMISDMAREQGVDCTVQMAQGGRPYEEIMRVAEREHCDAIFMASKARSTLGRMLLGSQTQKVLARSKVPVLVFR